MPTSTQDTPDSILHTVAWSLIPFFRIPDDSREAAYRTAVQAVAAYNPQSETDCVTAGRILALSLSAIAATAQAMDPGCPTKQQLQFLSRADALSRRALQLEIAWAKSRTQPNPASPQPKPAPAQRKPAASQPQPAPVCPQPAAAQPASPQPQPTPTRPISAPAPKPALLTADPATRALIDKALSAPRHSAPPRQQSVLAPALSPSSRPPSLRSTLLRGSVMPR